MRIVVIGGSGLQGSLLAKDIVNREGVTKVVITGRDLEKAKRVAGEIGKKAEAVSVSATDHEALVKVMKSGDVVANMTGPGAVYAVLVMKAAIQARVNYVDINDDADPIEAQFALDREAKEVGITMLCGMGLSPGLTDLYAKLAADHLDQTDTIEFAWCAAIGPARGPAVWGHRLDMYRSEIPQVKDGKLVYVPGGEDPKVFEFLPPIGRAEVLTCGHSEPLVMIRYIKGVKNIISRGGYHIAEFNHLIRRVSRELGFASKKPVKIGDTHVSPYTFFMHYAITNEFESTEIMQRVLAEEQRKGQEIALEMYVGGQKSRKPATYRIRFASRDRNKSINRPASVAAHLIATGKLRQNGVMYPEGISPQARSVLIDELAKSEVAWQMKLV